MFRDAETNGPMKSKNNIRQKICDFINEKVTENDEVGSGILLADGFDEAFVAVTYTVNSVFCAVYDYDKCISILCGNGGMEYYEAREYFEFNVLGAYVGVQTPLFIEMMNIES